MPFLFVSRDADALTPFLSDEIPTGMRFWLEVSLLKRVLLERREDPCGIVHSLPILQFNQSALLESLAGRKAVIMIPIGPKNKPSSAPQTPFPLGLLTR